MQNGAQHYGEFKISSLPPAFLPHHTPLNFQLILTQTCISSYQKVFFFSARAGPGLWDPSEGFKKDATFSLIDQLLHCPAAIFQLNSIQTCKISCQTLFFFGQPAWPGSLGPPRHLYREVVCLHPKLMI